MWMRRLKSDSALLEHPVEDNGPQTEMRPNPRLAIGSGRR